MPTRVSTNQIYTGGLEHISQARGHELSSAEKAQTNKEVNRPSDAPATWVRASNLKDGLSTGDNIQRNVVIANHFMTAADTALTQLQEFIQRTQELAISAADGNARRDMILKDAQGLWSSVLQTMNSRYGDRGLFGGFQTKAPAFDAEGNFLGDNNAIRIEIAAGSEPVPINFSASQIFLGMGLKEGVDIPMIYKNFIQGLQENNVELIQSCLPQLIQANEQISLGRGEVAGRMSQVSRALDSYASERTSTADSVSQLEDADAYKVFSELARDQTIFQSALMTNKKVLTEAPADILFK
ncbi:MAG: hypothetical protein HYR96_00640 [Deltaproteobacteria bacterium]|nr:hypothetical protein [Deltaproteobacteria bacterium]MBI3293996.1 hypothetical protein [Deltaproteobacteria bacterium]